MLLALGSRRYDLARRALVMGALGPTDGLLEQGADIVEVRPGHGPLPVPVCVVVPDDGAVGPALAGGADLVRLLRPGAEALRLCASAGVAVIVPEAALTEAAGAGLPPERVVLARFLLDVTGAADPTAATAVGVIKGARIVRTADVRGARRICDVLAAVLEAR